MTDIVVVDDISAKEAINRILVSAKAWYLPEMGYLVKNRGLFFDGREQHSHKWTENGKKFDFCLKCGIHKSIEQYYSHGCPVSAKQYNSFPFPKHTYEEVEIKSTSRPLWVQGKGFQRQPTSLYRFKVCRKCGIIESREKIFYKIDKETGNAYEVNSPVGAKKHHIHCSLTDDEYNVRDIII